METPANPFVYDRPVVPEDLVDREPELQLLLNLAESGQSARLSAPRRFGKTTLVRKAIAEVEKQGLVGVYVDLDRVVSIDAVSERIERAYRSQLQGAVKRTAANVIRTLRPRVAVGAPGVKGEVAPALEADSRRILERMLDLPIDLYAKTGRRTLVVLDEFQDVLRVGRELEGILRSHIQHQTTEASYVFAGSHPGLMLTLFSDREKPFFGQARPVELEPLEDGDLGEYIAKRFEETGRDPGDALDPLLELVRGHPQRAMLVAHHLWEATPPGQTAGLEEWAGVLEAVDRELSEAFERTWDRLNASESRVLAALSLSDETLFAERTLAHFGLTKSSAEKGRDKLLAFGDLRRAPNGAAILVDPLFERWVQQTQVGMRTGFLVGISRIGIDPL